MAKNLNQSKQKFQTDVLRIISFDLYAKICYIVIFIFNLMETRRTGKVGSGAKPKNYSPAKGGSLS